MMQTTQRTIYFRQSDHQCPLRAVKRANRLRFDKLVIVSDDVEFINSAKQYFVIGGTVEILPVGSILPINSVILEPSDEDSLMN
jgi:hypothetical protein